LTKPQQVAKNVVDKNGIDIVGNMRASRSRPYSPKMGKQFAIFNVSFRNLNCVTRMFLKLGRGGFLIQWYHSLISGVENAPKTDSRLACCALVKKGRSEKQPLGNAGFKNGN